MNAPSPDDPAAIAAWRTAERKRLRAARLDLTAEQRALAAQAIATELDRLVAGRLGDPAGHVITGYWPIKAEPSLLFWMEALHARGARIALPVVEAPSAPSVFRAWHPGARMSADTGTSPFLQRAPPAPSREHALPARPPVGLGPRRQPARLWRRGFRPHPCRPCTETLRHRVGLDASRIPTIVPQSHDIRLDAIVTEGGRK